MPACCPTSPFVSQGRPTAIASSARQCRRRSCRGDRARLSRGSCGCEHLSYHASDVDEVHRPPFLLLQSGSSCRRTAITEIVQNIAESRLILVTISRLRVGIALFRPTASDTQNVMYEPGIAHASRCPRGYHRAPTPILDFDIAGVRVHQYPAADFKGPGKIEGLPVMLLASIDQPQHRVKKAPEPDRRCTRSRRARRIEHPNMNRCRRSSRSDARSDSPLWPVAGSGVWTFPTTLWTDPLLRRITRRHPLASKCRRRDIRWVG